MTSTRNLKGWSIACDWIRRTLSAFVFVILTLVPVVLIGTIMAVSANKQNEARENEAGASAVRPMAARAFHVTGRIRTPSRGSFDTVGLDNAPVPFELRAQSTLENTYVFKAEMNHCVTYGNNLGLITAVQSGDGSVKQHVTIQKTTYEGWLSPIAGLPCLLEVEQCLATAHRRNAHEVRWKDKAGRPRITRTFMPAPDQRSADSAAAGFRSMMDPGTTREYTIDAESGDIEKIRVTAAGGTDSMVLLETDSIMEVELFAESSDLTTPVESSMLVAAD
jgi:hypothetical protein